MRIALVEVPDAFDAMYIIIKTMTIPNCQCKCISFDGFELTVWTAMYEISSRLQPTNTSYTIVKVKRFPQPYKNGISPSPIRIGLTSARFSWEPSSLIINFNASLLKECDTSHLGL